MRLFRYTLFGFLFFLSACSDDEGIKQTKFYAFGTEIDISLSGVDTATANQTLDSLETTFSQVDDTWHAWRPSTLSSINEAIAKQQTIAVSDDIAQLILYAQTLADKSEQLFNPAAGHLFALWGFHQDNWFSSRPPPAQAELDDWLDDAPSMKDIHIHNGLLNSDNTAAKLGFGAFAKGYAIDKAIEVLKAQNIDNALVNIGGDLKAIGQAGERPWVIGVRHPRQDGMLATLAISGNESVFTSGDYERFFTYEGERYPHIIDPRTGYPANEATSVTVLHQDASLADAAATALFVAGQAWPDIAAKMDIKHVMLVRPDGTIELSPAMSERINILDSTSPTLVRDLNG